MQIFLSEINPTLCLKTFTEMKNTVEQVKTHLRQWEPYTDMWKVNKDEYIASYEKQNYEVARFEADIGSYVTMINLKFFKDGVGLSLLVLINNNTVL